jgi:hypothetical protein
VYPNTTCSGTAATQLGVALVGGVAESATTTLGSGGLSYKVHYNGLADVYTVADGICETLVATAPSTTLSTSLSAASIVVGASAYQSAALGSATANATGTVAYNVYTNNACTTLSQNAGTRTVTNATVPNSDTVTFNTSGTFYWKANYSGDQNNASSVGACQTLTVLATSTPGTPGNNTASISGIVYNDVARNFTKDAGDPGLSGWTINLYKGAGWWGPHNGNPVFMTVVSDVNGNYSFGALASGTYSIEEINKTGWRQLTGDYRRVVVGNGEVLTNKNFGNASSTAKEVRKEEKKHEKELKKEEKKQNKLDNRFRRFQEFLKQFEIWKSNNQ